MKKGLFLLIVVAIILSISACGDEPSASNTETEQNGGKNQQQSKTEDFAYEITYSKANTYIDSIGSVWVQTIVEITNTGSKDLYFSAGSYDLEDSTESSLQASLLFQHTRRLLVPTKKLICMKKRPLTVHLMVN